VSRAAHPKPFMRLPDGESLLEKTLKRLAAIPHTGEVITVTNRELVFATREVYQAVPGEQRHLFLLEPQGRNTAAAVTLAALCAKERHGEDVLLLIMPADHLIGRMDRFASAIAEGAELAGKGRLVTFGIRPSSADTGFGYIERGAGAGTANGYLVASFTEKPPAERAEQYFKSGHHLWNSGMFCFSAGQVLRELSLHAPDVHIAVVACWNARSETKQGIEFRRSFSAIPAISIDCAVMEKSRNVAVVAGDSTGRHRILEDGSELAPGTGQETVRAGRRCSLTAELLRAEPVADGNGGRARS
jgi:mannose-1-phosphate guanylyltransferase